MRFLNLITEEHTDNETGVVTQMETVIEDQTIDKTEIVTATQPEVDSIDIDSSQVALTMSNESREFNSEITKDSIHPIEDEEPVIIVKTEEVVYSLSSANDTEINDLEGSEFEDTKTPNSTEEWSNILDTTVVDEMTHAETYTIDHSDDDYVSDGGLEILSTDSEEIDNDEKEMEFINNITEKYKANDVFDASVDISMDNTKDQAEVNDEKNHRENRENKVSTYKEDIVMEDANYHATLDSDTIIFDPQFATDPTIDWNKEVNTIKLVIQRPETSNYKDKTYAIVEWKNKILSMHPVSLLHSKCPTHVRRFRDNSWILIISISYMNTMRST
ncbi:hypothetical protein BDF14DRAFT_1995499 [Spinellus fusiger]|nr:hypothetical protein BDF14DRAFT_1995499 [Spinellus fusiger]